MWHYARANMRKFLGAVEFATNTLEFGVAAELDERG